MKKIIGLGVLAITMLFSSCNLDTAPSNQISVGQALGTVESLGMAKVGIYDYLRWGYNGDVTTHILGYGISGMLVEDDFVGGILVQKNRGNWWGAEYVIDSHSGGYRDGDTAYNKWYYYFSTIRRINDVLIPAIEMRDGGGVENANLMQLNQIIGELYGLRAYCYHSLNYRYSFRYDAAKATTILSVPIRETSTNEAIPRNTQAEVLTLVNSDIANSLTALAAGTGVSSDSYTFNIAAVKMLKARVQMFTYDYEGALITAEDIIKTSGRSIMGKTEYLSGFKLSNKESIFSLNVQMPNNPGYTGFAFLMANNFPSSWPNYSIDLSYVLGLNGNADLSEGEAEYSGGLPTTVGLTILPTDSRLDMIITETTVEETQAKGDQYYLDRGFNPTKGFLPGMFRKFQQVGTGATGAGDIFVIRLAEAYYIAAESASMSGNDVLARKHLISTAESYDSAAAAHINSKSGAGLRTLINNYKSVDMIGEGRALEDIKRRGEWVYRIQKYSPVASYTATRQYKSTPPFVTRTIPFMDVTTEVIPKLVKDANIELVNNFQ